MIDIEARFRDAIRHYWIARGLQKQKNIQGGRIDPGSRGAVVGGAQMGALEVLVTDILIEAGLDASTVKTRTALELPGYFRPEKKWDLLIVSGGKLIAAMEFKSQVGPSFGNNFNNRVEEAIGSATDVWTAYREGRLGNGPQPFLGYFFLLEDCEKVHTPVRNSEPYFVVDEAFKNAAYSDRYTLMIRRLVRERLYTAACLTLTSSSEPYAISHPAPDLDFTRFVAHLKGLAAQI